MRFDDIEAWGELKDRNVVKTTIGHLFLQPSSVKFRWRISGEHKWNTDASVMAEDLKMEKGSWFC